MPVLSRCPSRGGAPLRRRYAEDITFLLALERLGARRGQRFVRLPDAEAIASVRKIHEQGDWHMLSFPFRYTFRKVTGGADAAEALVNDYW